MINVFVYGSLLSSEANHGVLRGARALGATTTVAAFTLFDLGPYPALVAGGDTAVEGELYVVDAALLARLDRFEDHPNLYRRGPIALACGTEASAYFFVDEAQARACPVVGPSWRRTRVRAARS